MKEQSVDYYALLILTKRFDEFVMACMDDKGRPIAPSPQALAKARGYLPASAAASYKGK